MDYHLRLINCRKTRMNPLPLVWQQCVETSSVRHCVLLMLTTIKHFFNRTIFHRAAQHYFTHYGWLQKANAKISTRSQNYIDHIVHGPIIFFQLTAAALITASLTKKHLAQNKNTTINCDKYSSTMLSTSQRSQPHAVIQYIRTKSSQIGTDRSIPPLLFWYLTRDGSCCKQYACVLLAPQKPARTLKCQTELIYIHQQFQDTSTVYLRLILDFVISSLTLF